MQGYFKDVFHSTSCEHPALNLQQKQQNTKTRIKQKEPHIKRLPITTQQNILYGTP